MIVSYPPFYPQQILDADGKPVAGGRILSFYAGTDVPLAMFAPDGVSLGSSVNIASDGTAVFCLKVGVAYKPVCKDADGALVWTRDNVKVNVAGDGMANPMEAQADVIVGAVDGQPERLAAPANASFLRSYKNSDNVPVVKWSRLKAGANVTITDSGTQVTVAADTQPGDHQLLVSATDASAGYLGAKLTAGSNVTLTPQTDGDGVQTLEISATGGGGGGGARMLFTNGVPNCASTGTHGSNYESIYVAPFFAQFDKVGSIALLPYGLPSDTRIIPPTLDLCIYEGATKSAATKITSFTYSAPASWSLGVPLWFDFDEVADIDLLKNHWVAVKCSSWATGYRHNWVLTASQNTSVALGDANSAEMTRPYRQLNAGAGSLPAALSGISGNAYLDYGMTLWYSASTTKMHS